MVRVATTSIVNLVAPRTFREPRPGITFFFDRVAADGRSFEGVFLSPRRRVRAAATGSSSRDAAALTLEGDRLWLDLFQSTVHELDAADPSRDRVEPNETQRLLLAGDTSPPPGASVRRPAGPAVPDASRALAGRAPASPPRPAKPPPRLGRDPQEVRDPVGVPRLRAGRRSPGAGAPARGPRGQLRPLARRSCSATTSCSRAARPGPRRAAWPRRSRCGCPTCLLVALGVGAALWRPAGRVPRTPRPPIADPHVNLRARFPPPRRVRPPRSDCSRSSTRRARPLPSRRSPRFRLRDPARGRRRLRRQARRGRAPPPGRRRRPRLLPLLHPVDRGPDRAVRRAARDARRPAACSRRTPKTRRSAPRESRSAGSPSPSSSRPGSRRGARLRRRRVRPPPRRAATGPLPQRHLRPSRRTTGIRTAAERNWYLAARREHLVSRGERSRARNALLGVAIFRLAPTSASSDRTDAREAVWSGGQWTLKDGLDALLRRQRRRAVPPFRRGSRGGRSARPPIVAHAAAGRRRCVFASSSG